jgi:quinoprotein glucose dehydrogenase
MHAIDLNTAEYLWRIPLGNHPELQKSGEPPTGMENYGGPVVTAGGLVFIAATMDRMFRAFDKDTGELLWEIQLPGNGLANPAVYQINGRQYITISVSVGESFNHTKSGLVTFSLPPPG